jgi:hypothetical protein
MMDIERFNRIDEKSKTVTDLLGMPIDRGIRELIVLLNYNNIGTTASCWGHKNWGNPYPWVTIHPEHLGDLFTIISDLDIETDKIFNREMNFFEISIFPRTKDLSEGRKTFNKLKKKLKNGK